MSTLNSSAIYEAIYTEAGTATEGRPINLILTLAPSMGPLPLQVKDNIQGLFTVQDGEESVTRFLNLGLGLANPAAPATTFDDAMGKLEFVLISCKGTTHCDFTPAKVPE
jgi:hypothetical protein